MSDPETERLASSLREQSPRLDELDRHHGRDEDITRELAARVNALETALIDVCKLMKTYKWRMPATLLAWYSKQLP